MKRGIKTAVALGVLAGIIVAAGVLITQPAEIAPLTQPAGPFSAQSIARGKTLAALGDCAVCHTRQGGAVNSGGLAMESPFGTIYTSNITPDISSGIGGWSYPAFQRAMRHGIDRSGSYLYPAFPYTSFTQTRDDDLQDLYAWLMSQPAVNYQPPRTALSFPFNIRRGMMLWNALYLQPGARPDDPQQDALWNRGAYLAESLGHCSACHSPRNFAAAEKQGSQHLAGGVAEGWTAPALNALSPAPVSWSEAQLQHYLRYGFATEHGVAAGPMGPVVAQGLSQLAEADLQAIAHWLAGMQPASSASAGALTQRAEQRSCWLNSAGARQYSGSCMACHSQEKGPQLDGVRPALALNRNLYLAEPDNLIRIVLDGITPPAGLNTGSMPGFRHQLSDSQIAVLLNWLRGEFAGQAPWPDLTGKVAAIRQQTAEQTP